MKYLQTAMDYSRNPLITGHSVYRLNVIVAFAYPILIAVSLVWKFITYPGGPDWCEKTYKILTDSVLVMWLAINIASALIMCSALFMFVRFAQTVKTDRLLINKMTLALHLIMAIAECLIIIIYFVTLAREISPIKVFIT